MLPHTMTGSAAYCSGARFAGAHGSATNSYRLFRSRFHQSRVRNAAHVCCIIAALASPGFNMTERRQDSDLRTFVDWLIQQVLFQDMPAKTARYYMERFGVPSEVFERLFGVMP